MCLGGECELLFLCTLWLLPPGQPVLAHCCDDKLFMLSLPLPAAWGCFRPFVEGNLVL